MYDNPRFKLDNPVSLKIILSRSNSRLRINLDENWIFELETRIIELEKWIN
jgi:hypothetical protein